MTKIVWKNEIQSREQAFIEDTQNLLRIKSVLDEENGTSDAPFGKGIKEALDFMFELAVKDGFTIKNVDNVAGHIEMGEGEEIVGILCHLDVVPEGSGWKSDPFGAEIRDGRIYARGALDDKGPTMAAYYAMKMIKELELPLAKRVRMILGTDEESLWRCVDRYFETEEMPTLGFAPDADFPIINAEKGIWDFMIRQTVQGTEDATIQVKDFSSGQRLNMVPDYGRALLTGNQGLKDAETEFHAFLARHSLSGRATIKEQGLALELEGVSAHGMEPNNGVNAGLYLAAFLAKLELPSSAKAYFTFITDYFFNDSRAEKLKLAYSDKMTGDLTINAGTFNYSEQAGGTIGFTMRYPVSFDYETGKASLIELLGKHNFTLETISNSVPHHVPAESFLVKVLQKVYEEQTGQKAELLSIGGGTYARSLKEGVAFGPLFPGSEDIAHQKDEYIDIENLKISAAIYAQAIHELAK